MSRSRKKNPYRGSRRFDFTCRCNGSCPYCRANRLHNTRRKEEEARDKLNEWKKGAKNGRGNSGQG